jgi:undecaprenyl-diphosphatase
VSLPDPKLAPEAEGPPLWHYLLAFAALLVVGLAFGEMAEQARRKVPDGLDLHVTRWVHAHHREWPWLEHLFRAVTLLGNQDVAAPSTVAVAVILIVLGRRRVAELRKRDAFFWLGTVASAWAIGSLLKLWFRRQRPPVSLRSIVIIDDSFSFPSGHSVYAAVFFSMLALLMARLVPRSRAWLRYVAFGICGLLALLVGASRVWLVVHYPTDVLGGLLLGVGWVLIAYTIRSGWREWRRRRALGERRVNDGLMRPSQLDAGTDPGLR